MSEPTPSVSKLDQHMAVVGQVMARFVSEGLLGQPIDTFAPEDFLDAPVDPRTFEAVITWMLDEGIIRGKERIQTIDGRLRITAAQLTAKGLAIVKYPLASAGLFGSTRVVDQASAHSLPRVFTVAGRVTPRQSARPSLAR